MNDWLTYANQGAIRNQHLSPELIAALGPIAQQMGLGIEVFSGGQDGIGSGGSRTGSTRHDHGNAADIFLTRDGQRLDWSDPEQLSIFSDFVRQASAAGVTGIGAGDGYMQQGSMHVGFGNPAVWGAGGKGANAPDWLKTAWNEGRGMTMDEHLNATNQMLASGGGDDRLAGGLSMVGGRGLLGGSQDPMGSMPAMLAPPELTKGEKIRGFLGNMSDRLISYGRGTPLPAQKSGDAMIEALQDKKGRNATAEYLRQQGHNDLATAVLSGQMTGREAMAIVQQQNDPMRQAQLELLQLQLEAARNPQAEQPKPTDDIREYEYAVGQGYPGTFQDFMNEGRRASTPLNVGSIPSGYELVRNGDSSFLRPLEGGPVATEQKQESTSLEMATADYDRKYKVVDSKLDEAITELAENGRWVAGAGSILSNLPETAARDFKATIDTIKANLGFEELQAMRDASPTGGALGQVTEREIAYLQATMGNLDLAQSPQQLMEVLQDIKRRRAEFAAERRRIMSGGTLEAWGPRQPMTPPTAEQPGPSMSAPGSLFSSSPDRSPTSQATFGPGPQLLPPVRNYRDMSDEDLLRALEN